MLHGATCRLAVILSLVLTSCSNLERRGEKTFSRILVFRNGSQDAARRTHAEQKMASTLESKLHVYAAPASKVVSGPYAVSDERLRSAAKEASLEAVLVVSARASSW